MKPERRYRIVVVLLLMLPARIFSQQQMPLFAQKIPHLLQNPVLLNKYGSNQLHYFHQDLSGKTAAPNLNVGLLHLVSPDYYTNHFGFFCRQELWLQKETYIPFRFRLGSLNYVNQMEGKGKAIMVIDR